MLFFTYIKNDFNLIPENFNCLMKFCLSVFCVIIMIYEYLKFRDLELTTKQEVGTL